MIGWLVDRYHVSTPTEAVVAKVRRKVKGWKDLPKEKQAEIEAAVRERHEANRKLYMDVMYGGV